MASDLARDRVSLVLTAATSITLPLPLPLLLLLLLPMSMQILQPWSVSVSHPRRNVSLLLLLSSSDITATEETLTALHVSHQQKANAIIKTWTTCDWNGTTSNRSHARATCHRRSPR
jgi:hypothetical protein